MLLQLVGDEVGELGIADEGALGDFEDETLEGEVCLLGGGTDMAGKGPIGELGEGDIDGEGEVLGKDACGGEGVAEEMLGELADDSGLFGERDEVSGIDGADYRMLPAGKDLEAGEHTGAELDERLEVGDDLIIFQRSTEVELSLFLVNHCQRILRCVRCDFSGKSSLFE